MPVLKVWQLHFENRTLALSWVTFLLIVAMASFLQEVVHEELKDRMPRYYWKVKGFAITMALTIAILATILRITSMGLVTKFCPKLFCPVKYIICISLLVCVFIMMVVMLGASVGYLGFFTWYNPNVFKVVKSQCPTGGLCNGYCSGDAKHCCLVNFDQAHQGVIDVFTQKFNKTNNPFTDLALPSLRDGSDPVAVGTFLQGYFSKHPVQCIDVDLYDTEERLAQKGKKYGFVIFALAFAAAMCYNYCTVYVFEVQNFLFVNAWHECCPGVCRRRAKPKEVQAREITEPLMK